MVLVDEACDGGMAFDSGWGQGDECRVVVGGELVAALVGSVVVEVVGVVAEDFLGVAAVQEQDPVGPYPPRWSRPLTWDQGSEMAAHATFSLPTTVDIYFAHPHSPWERGTNDNINRLFREYFPKGTTNTDDQTYPDTVARELNKHPHRILGYRTPVGFQKSATYSE
ncbi:MAG: IS30 family transposase [Pseudonocardiaceae bacterium]